MNLLNNKLLMAGRFAQGLLLVMTTCITGFALISGSESFGGGLSGMIHNAPNALPWLGLLIAVIWSFRDSRTGGAITVVLGLAFLWYYNTGANFFLATFIATLIIPLLGVIVFLKKPNYGK